MRPAGPHVCPACGERVSAFAAGCALCGADLDLARAQGPPTLARRARRLADRLRTTPSGNRRRR